MEAGPRPTGRDTVAGVSRRVAVQFHDGLAKVAGADPLEDGGDGGAPLREAGEVAFDFLELG